MKHFLKGCTLALCVCILAATLSGCVKKEVPVPEQSAQASIYATFYPLYALAEPLLHGIDDMRLNCLVQPQDGCLRSYQLSDWDLALAASANGIIAGGNGLESFENILYALGESGPAVSAVLYEMDLMQRRGVNTSEDSSSHWLDANPHIYMSVDGAIEIMNRIAAAFSIWDAQHEEQYQNNRQNAENRLKSLKAELQDQLSFAQGTRVIVMNEALIYTAKDFSLEIAMCYDRESGEMLSETDLASCLRMLENSGAKLILIEKQAPKALCDALELAGYTLARMDILSTGRAEQGFEGYIAALQGNACILEEALRGAATPSGK